MTGLNMFIASHVHKNNSFVGFVTSFSFVGLLLGSEHLEFAPNVVETNFEVSASANPSESCAILATNADRSFTFDLRRDSFKCDTSGHDSLKSRDVSPIVCALFATQSPGFGYFCRLSGLSFQISIEDLYWFDLCGCHIGCTYLHFCGALVLPATFF